jgi:signal transduction histidine kinase
MELKKLNDYKDELLASVTHDLRTPLNSIKASLISVHHDLATRRLAELPIANIRKKLSIGLKSSNLLDFLIQDILDYSMINKNVFRLSPQNIDIIACVREVFELIADVARDK